MPIENMLVISTANLDPVTAENLANGVHFGVPDVFTREYGYLMFPNAIQVAVDEGNPVPKCLRDVAKLAKLDNCTLIMFDCDADPDGRIPEFDW